MPNRDVKQKTYEQGKDEGYEDEDKEEMTRPNQSYVRALVGA